jgi:hypothetical protein
MSRWFLLPVLATLLSAAQAITGHAFETRDLSLQQTLVVSVPSPAPGTLTVDAWVDRTTDTYRIGEPVRLFARANKDAHFAVVAIGPTGNAVQLYPNVFQPAVEVKAEVVLEVPGPGAAIVASAPPGTELIRVAAATAPITFIREGHLGGEAVFRSIIGGAETVARDLQLVETSGSVEVAYFDKIIRTVGEHAALPEPEAGEVEIASQPEGADEGPQMTPEQTEIAALQLRLADAGCYAGPIDGISGPQTRQAIRQCPDMEPVLRIETGMHTAPIHGSVDRACRVLATNSNDKTVRLWSLPDGALIRTQRLPIGPARDGDVFRVAVSPTGSTVAAGGWSTMAARASQSHLPVQRRRS